MTRPELLAMALDLASAADVLGWTMRTRGENEEAARWENRAKRARAVAVRHGAPK
jgi:hypothetical protein